MVQFQSNCEGLRTMSESKYENRRRPMSSQIDTAERKNFFYSAFHCMAVFNGLDGTHLHWEGQYALLKYLFKC